MKFKGETLENRLFKIVQLGFFDSINFSKVGMIKICSHELSQRTFLLFCLYLETDLFSGFFSHLGVKEAGELAYGGGRKMQEEM